MPRSGVSVPQGERVRHDDRPGQRYGGGGAAFERFGTEEPTSDSYRVEVERYWKRTASRRSQFEARQARRTRRFSGEATGAGERTGGERTGAAERTSARELTTGSERSAEARPAEAGGAGDPYRELLHSWARETAQELEGPRSKGPVAPGRRTVTITGYGAEGSATRNGTRPSLAERHRQLPRHERAGFQPDRVAMWAVLLGVLMVLAAAASAHAAVIAHHVLAVH